MKIPDVQLFVQSLVYLAIILTGFCVAVPIGLTATDFGGNCLLYADLVESKEGHYTYRFSSKVNCNLGIYYNVFAAMFFSLGMFCYYGYALCKRDRDIASQMWVMPFVLVTAALAIVSFIVSCIISVGFKTLCDRFLKMDYIHSCSDAQKITWNKVTGGTYGQSNFYDYLTVAQVASWIGFLLWCVQCALCVVRFVRNRRLRSQAYMSSVNTDTQNIGAVEPTA